MTGEETRTDDRAPQEDLAMIRRLMEDSRRAVAGGSGHFVLWGFITAAALLLTYGSVALGMALPLGWVWGIGVGLGWAVSIWIGRRTERRAPVHTAAGRLIGAIWIGCGIAMTLIGFVGTYGGALGRAGMLGAISCVIGVGVFATSFAYGAGWMRWLAAAWWLGASAIFTVARGPVGLLLVAGMMIGLFLIPGLVLMRREKRPDRSTRAARGGAVS